MIRSAGPLVNMTSTYLRGESISLFTNALICHAFACAASRVSSIILPSWRSTTNTQERNLKLQSPRVFSTREAFSPLCRCFRVLPEVLVSVVVRRSALRLCIWSRLLLCSLLYHFRPSLSLSPSLSPLLCRHCATELQLRYGSASGGENCPPLVALHECCLPRKKPVRTAYWVCNVNMSLISFISNKKVLQRESIVSCSSLAHFKSSASAAKDQQDVDFFEQA